MMQIYNRVCLYDIKVDMILSTSREVFSIYSFAMFLETSRLEALNFVCNSVLPGHEIPQLIIWLFNPLNCNASDLWCTLHPHSP
jgi:hypothetical protein